MTMSDDSASSPRMQACSNLPLCKACRPELMAHHSCAEKHGALLVAEVLFRSFSRMLCLSTQNVRLVLCS